MRHTHAHTHRQDIGRHVRRARVRTYYNYDVCVCTQRATITLVVRIVFIPPAARCSTVHVLILRAGVRNLVSLRSSLRTLTHSANVCVFEVSENIRFRR